jgi:hypothetical protein
MNSKISELDLVSVVDQNDVLPIVNGGITKKVKVSQLEQDLQSVTDVGATTTNGITVNAPTGRAISGVTTQGEGVYGYGEFAGVFGQSNAGIGVYALSNTGNALQAISASGNGIYASSNQGAAIRTYSAGNGTPNIQVDLGAPNTVSNTKGIVIDSAEPSTGNPIEVKKNGVQKFGVAQNGDVTTDVISANGDVLTLEAGPTKIEINDVDSEINIIAGNFNVNCPISTTLVNANLYRLPALNTAPATATSTGILGEIRYTAGFIYVCIATNTWRRTALTDW